MLTQPKLMKAFINSLWGSAYGTTQYKIPSLTNQAMTRMMTLDHNPHDSKINHYKPPSASLSFFCFLFSLSPFLFSFFFSLYLFALTYLLLPIHIYISMFHQSSSLFSSHFIYCYTFMDSYYLLILYIHYRLADSAPLSYSTFLLGFTTSPHCLFSYHFHPI